MAAHSPLCLLVPSMLPLFPTALPECDSSQQASLTFSLSDRRTCPSVCADPPPLCHAPLSLFCGRCCCCTCWSRSDHNSRVGMKMTPRLATCWAIGDLFDLYFCPLAAFVPRTCANPSSGELIPLFCTLEKNECFLG